MNKITSAIQLGSSSASILREQVVLVAVLGALALLAMVFPIQDALSPFQIYLPLHTSLEFLAICLAFLVFATVWHTPARQVSMSLLFIAVALFSAGWLDFAHALSYKGMPDLITPSSREKGIAFWLVARFMVAVTLFGVSFYPQMVPPSRYMRYGVLAAYTVVNFTVLGVVFFYESFLPATFIEGVGLTGFKVSVEWVITGLLVLAAWRYYRQALRSVDEFPAFIFGAAAAAALGEMFFAGYADVNDVQNLLGHLYKIVSYSLIYQAMFVISFRKPYDRLADQTKLLVRANEALCTQSLALMQANTTLCTQSLALMQANTTLRTQAMALESTTALVFVTDSEGCFLWQNRACYRLLGGREEDIGHLSLFKSPITPDAKVAATMRETVLTSGQWRGIGEIKDVDGKIHIMNRTVTPLLNEAGVLEGFVSVSDDMTENRRAKERHKRVLDSAIDGFWIADIDGNLLEVNVAFVRMSGYTKEELLTKNFQQLDPADLLQEVKAYLKKTDHLGHDQIDMRFRHKLGHEFPVALSVTFDPEVQQFFVFVRNTTDQVQSVAVQLNLERQLQQSQKMEAMGQLTGGIAHDFNNILVSVLGYSKLALDRLVPDKQSKLANYLREIVMASERARDLIAKMLLSARTPSNNNANVGLISPAAIVHEVLSMMRPSITSSIQFDVQMEDELYILMDAGELNQILINLIINARDAIAGQGMVGIRLHKIEVNDQICTVSLEHLTGSYVALEVTDNGSGIAPEHIPRLFDPFFTTKDVGKGTGLGLSMVLGILRRAGSHIVVESQLGLGSQFQLLFPITSPYLSLPSTQAAPQGLRCGSGQHIAVVDDEPAVTRYLSELLEGQGYRVTPFNNPVDALTAVGSGDQVFDLVITDQTMPGLSGAELAVRLRSAKPGLPVILCTGYGGRIDNSDVLQTVIRHHLIKPFSADDLLKILALELG